MLLLSENIMEITLSRRLHWKHHIFSDETRQWTFLFEIFQENSGGDQKLRSVILGTIIFDALCWGFIGKTLSEAVIALVIVFKVGFSARFQTRSQGGCLGVFKNNLYPRRSLNDPKLSGF